MSRDILIKVDLDFEEKDKQKIKDILYKKFEGNETIITDAENYLTFELWNWNLTEEDFDELKKVCSNISKSEYECLDEECFIWEKELK